MPNFVKNLPFWMYLGKVDVHTNLGSFGEDYDHANLQEAQKPENAKKLWLSGDKTVPLGGIKKIKYWATERTIQGGARNTQNCGAKNVLQDGAKDIQQGGTRNVHQTGAQESQHGGGKQPKQSGDKIPHHGCTKPHMKDNDKHITGVLHHESFADNQNGSAQDYESALHIRAKEDKAYDCFMNNHYMSAKDDKKTSAKNDEDTDQQHCTKQDRESKPNECLKLKDQPGGNIYNKTIHTPICCSHVLPLSKDNCGVEQVTGAPKINPCVGKIITRAKRRYLKLSQLQTSKSFCNACCDERLLSLKKSDQKYSEKSAIPGLLLDAKKTKLTDNNLIPLSNSFSKTIQYGDTSILSVHTDDPRWSPGECLNLSWYGGRFLIKKGTLKTQKVLTLKISIGNETNNF